jgi:hypothetical protein
MAKLGNNAPNSTSYIYLASGLKKYTYLNNDREGDWCNVVDDYIEPL